ncbi:MAG: sulfatase-like hydrolase/transferase [Pseudomonadota bacterium]
MDRPENILFLSVEDLNDYITPLGGHPDAVTPNLQRLADRGALFTNAMSTSPACSPARTATMFGQAPWRTGIYFNEHKHWHFYPKASALSLPGYLKSLGWKTYGTGKIFHGRYDCLDMADWSDYFYKPQDKLPAYSKVLKSGMVKPMMDFGAAPRGEPLWDDFNFDFIQSKITPEARGCFWAYGVYRPHLPFIAPEEYFDLIPEQPSNPPGLYPNAYGDHDPTYERLPEAARMLLWRSAFNGRKMKRTGEYYPYLRAYLASSAYADALIGKVLDRLEETGQADKTLIVLWSDHGQQFGEKTGFRKFTLTERSLRVPIMISGPGISPSKVGDAVSLLDIYPTLLSYLGLDAPHHLDGQDLTPLISGDQNSLRGHAVSVWGVEEGMDFNPALTVRTKTHRYCFYWNGEEELYDHRTDPFEHHNLAAGADQASLIEELAGRLPNDMAPPIQQN